MNNQSMRSYAILSLLALSIAAATGSLLRFGLYMGMPSWAQNFTAVRHAHSHLMVFGWGTLAIFALIWQFLPRLTGRPLPQGVNLQMAATAVVALLSFPAFWINGYGPTQIGPLTLPLGAMISGWNGLAWIWFIYLYVRATQRLSLRPLAVQLWDWAIVLLLLACVGVLGLMATIATDHPSFFLQQAMLHLFLDLFAVGWFTLALLGLLWAWVGDRTALPGWLPTGSLALCLAPTFFLGMTPIFVSEPVFWVAVLANLAAAALLAVHGWALWQRRAHLPFLVRFALLPLAGHILIAIVLVWPGLWAWGAGTGLRVFFLHNLLLGWLSSLLLGLILVEWLSISTAARQILAWLWVAGVVGMLLALLSLGLTALIPQIAATVWLQLAAWSSLPLVGVAVLLLVVATRKPTVADRILDESNLRQVWHAQL